MRRPFTLLVTLALFLAGVLLLLSARAAVPLTPVSPAPVPGSDAANALAVDQARARAATAQARGDLTALVAALNDEADADLRLHQLDEAEGLRLRVLHLEEQHAGRDSLPVSDALLNLGWFYANMARYAQAQDALDRCQDIRLRLLGQDAAPVAEVLNALGSLEENRGNLDLAQAFYEQAVAIQEKALGLQSPVTANTQNNLATLYWVMGDYASAQRLFVQALAVREKTDGPESAIVAKTLNNLAMLDVSLGDYDEAEDYFQRALRIRTARLGPDNPATLGTLGQLGLLYVREGDDARAEPFLVRAVTGQEKVAPEDDPDIARTLEDLAMLYDRRGAYAQAGPLHQQALEMRRRLLGPQHPEYAESLAALARHEHAQGHFAAALPLYEEALKIDEEALGPNHPDTIAVAGDLAFLDIEIRRPDDATRLAHDLAEAQRAVLNSVFTFAPEQQRMTFERTMSPCDLPAALADGGLLAEMVLRTKGVVLDSLLEDEAVTRAERDPELRDLLEKRREILARLGEGPDDPAGNNNSAAPVSSGAERRQLEEQVQQLESSLAGRGLGDGATRRALETTTADVCDALPEGAALVEYVAYHRYTGRLTSQACYGAVVLTRAAPPQWLALGPQAEIDARVHLAQKYMRRRVRDATVASVLRGLYAALAQPVVAALPAGTHRLIISPDGDLNFVSFAPLLDADDHFLASSFDISYVSSGRDLLEKPEDPPRTRTLAVFADPDYSRLPGGAAGRAHGSAHDDDPLPPLPGTEREAALIQAEAVQAGVQVQTFRGISASKANLAALNSPYILHLATHGLYLAADDVPLVPERNGDGDKAALVAEPMTRSLLALAGASVTLREWRHKIFPPADNDGLLTAQQAAALNLDHTWLVVLSACDSGGGEAQNGEGVIGLRRGFAEAGVENLLMTLWTADDATTAELMQAFYREALKSGDAAGALARVQRASLEDARKKYGLSEAVRKSGPFILSF